MVAALAIPTVMPTAIKIIKQNNPDLIGSTSRHS
jgi:hypothetical protein